MGSYLMPKRGRKSTAIQQSIVLRSGEIFFETPDKGAGKGPGKIKMGDGVTDYADLPYFTSDINDEIIEFTDTLVPTDKSLNDTYLANIKPSNSLKTIFTNLKQLLFNYNKQLNDLDSNKANLVDGSVPLSELGDAGSAITNIEFDGITGSRIFFKTTLLNGTESSFDAEPMQYAAGTGLKADTSTPGVTDFSVKYGAEAGTVCQGNDGRLSNARVPTSHAASTKIYGGATSTNYGHVKLSDEYTEISQGNADNSVGASQYAVNKLYKYLLDSYVVKPSYWGSNSLHYYSDDWGIAAFNCVLKQGTKLLYVNVAITLTGIGLVADRYIFSFPDANYSDYIHISGAQLPIYDMDDNKLLGMARVFFSSGFNGCEFASTADISANKRILINGVIPLVM